MNLLIDLQLFPCVTYFECLMACDSVYLEACENFQKQSYRNRFSILAANKVDTLTIPVLKSNSKVRITEVEIDYSQPWQKIHWRAIQSAYGKAPYFEYYSDYFKRLYDKRPKYLWEFNLEALTVCLALLGVEKPLLFTEEYNKEGQNHVEDIIDKRSLIHPKVESRGNQERYTQVFGREFVPNLSIIDLIFNEGPNGRKILGLR